MQIVAGSAVRSVQRGQSVFSGTTTLNVGISTVNPAKSFINAYLDSGSGMVCHLSGGAEIVFARATGTGNAQIRWEVIEYV
jgi:hypothetical protein